MNMQILLDQILAKLTAKGADKAAVYGGESNFEELQFEHNEIDLLRGFTENSLNIKVIKDHKLASTSLNQLTETAIDSAIKQVMDDAQNSQPDEAYDMSDLAVNESFEAGIMQPDRDTMYERIDNFLTTGNKLFPSVNLEGSITHFSSDLHYKNSLGVNLSEKQGGYAYWTMFSAREGKKVSSFNYTMAGYHDLKREFLEMGITRQLIEQSVASLHCKPVPETFEGDIILAPGLANEFMSYLVYGHLTDTPMITGDSILKGKIDEKVLDQRINLCSDPVNPDLANGSFIHKDGFVAEKVNIFQDGVLKNYMLSLFGANKTGLSMSKASGRFVLKAGNSELKDMIKDVKKGLYVVRFSGGNPSSNGDFSGIAKNSYYIENGEIKFPVNETMISGNLLKIFQNLNSISSKRINTGHYIMPWLSCHGVNVSR